jgi:hypothetical protein
LLASFSWCFIVVRRSSNPIYVYAAVAPDPHRPNPNNNIHTPITRLIIISTTSRKPTSTAVRAHQGRLSPPPTLLLLLLLAIEESMMATSARAVVLFMYVYVRRVLHTAN